MGTQSSCLSHQGSLIPSVFKHKDMGLQLEEATSKQSRKCLLHAAGTLAFTSPVVQQQQNHLTASRWASTAHETFTCPSTHNPEPESPQFGECMHLAGQAGECIQPFWETLEETSAPQTVICFKVPVGFSFSLNTPNIISCEHFHPSLDVPFPSTVSSWEDTLQKAEVHKRLLMLSSPYGKSGLFPTNFPMRLPLSGATGMASFSQYLKLRWNLLVPVLKQSRRQESCCEVGAAGGLCCVWLSCDFHLGTKRGKSRHGRNTEESSCVLCQS